MILSEIDCWTGYKKQGTKKGKNGNRVNNCVKEDDSDSEKTNNASSRAVKLLQNLDIFTDADKITEIVNDMTLTDMLALDTAFQNQDLEYLEKLFNDITDTVESTLPGRSNVTSAASPVTAPTSAAVDLDDDEEEIEQPDEKTSIKPKSSDSTRGTTSPMSPGLASWKKREDQMEEAYITRIKQLSGIAQTVVVNEGFDLDDIALGETVIYKHRESNSYKLTKATKRTSNRQIQITNGDSIEPYNIVSTDYSDWAYYKNKKINEDV